MTFVIYRFGKKTAKIVGMDKRIVVNLITEIPGDRTEYNPHPVLPPMNRKLYVKAVEWQNFTIIRQAALNIATSLFSDESDVINDAIRYGLRLRVIDWRG